MATITFHFNNANNARTLAEPFIPPSAKSILIMLNTWSTSACNSQNILACCATGTKIFFLPKKRATHLLNFTHFSGGNFMKGVKNSSFKLSSPDAFISFTEIVSEKWEDEKKHAFKKHSPVKRIKKLCALMAAKRWSFEGVLLLLLLLLHTQFPTSHSGLVLKVLKCLYSKITNKWKKRMDGDGVCGGSRWRTAKFISVKSFTCRLSGVCEMQGLLCMRPCCTVQLLAIVALSHPLNTPLSTTVSTTPWRGPKKNAGVTNFLILNHLKKKTKLPNDVVPPASTARAVVRCHGCDTAHD